MRSTLQVLLQLRNEGLLPQFAIGGAIAATYFAEAVTTEDLDIFAFLRPSDSGLLVLTPLYRRLEELGGTVRNEHVVIHGWPVQILPAYTPLVEAAVLHAVDRPFEDLSVPVVDADYLCAIALQTGREKDYQRIFALQQAGCVSEAALGSLIKTYHLEERWQTFQRRYG
jgi:hypothetical protein